jgi:mannonate dehydratase
MKITAARVIVCSPGRNFVTLKIETDQGLTGLGDATLNGRELAVASYLTDHVIPCLIGRDAHRIEDTWQYLYRGAYWRRGPVTMSAIAAVDTALWDLKAKAAGMPLYQLLGGASRERVLVYAMPTAATSNTRWTRCCATANWATRPSARKAACRGWTRSTAWPAETSPTSPPTPTCPASTPGRPRNTCATCRCCSTPCAARSGDDVHLLHDAHHRLTPIEAARLAQGPRALPPVLAGRCHAGREPGGLPPDAPAQHDADRGGRGLQYAVGLQGPDRAAAHRLHPRHRRACRRHHPPAAHRRPGGHPPGAHRLPRRHRPERRCAWARRCISTSGCPISASRSTCRTRDETDAVFPHAYRFERGYMHPGEAPGHGVEIDEALAARYPYQRAYLPVNRQQHDGTLWHW